MSNNSWAVALNLADNLRRTATHPLVRTGAEMKARKMRAQKRREIPALLGGGIRHG